MMTRNLYIRGVAILFLAVSATLAQGDVKIGNEAIFKQKFITDCYVTGYFCVYNTELDGFQTITKKISDSNYTLKASFLFGGRGVAMQGTGKTAPDGDYIKYAGGGGNFIRITGPDAGKNLNGKWIINPKTLQYRYAKLGITDFAGFGNLALLSPNDALFVKVNAVTGSMGQPLVPWCSISVDTSLIPLDKTVTLSFKNDSPGNDKPPQITCKTQDIGGSIKGKHIEIYLGQGQAAIDEWNRSGGNRLVDIYSP